MAHTAEGRLQPVGFEGLPVDKRARPNEQVDEKACIQASFLFYLTVLLLALSRLLISLDDRSRYPAKHLDQTLPGRKVH